MNINEAVTDMDSEDQVPLWSPDAERQLNGWGFLSPVEWMTVQALQALPGGVGAAKEADYCRAFLAVSDEEAHDLGFRALMYSSLHDLPHRCLKRQEGTLHYYLEGVLDVVWRTGWVPPTRADDAHEEQAEVQA